MMTNDLFIKCNEIEKERINYIFSTFKKDFPNVCYNERKSIVGIDEQDKYLLCYFKISEEKILVKFKSSKKSIDLMQDIEIIDLNVKETINLFKLNDYTKNRSKKTINNTIETENIDDISILIKPIVSTYGDVLISNLASPRLANALRKRKIYKIADLDTWDAIKLKGIRFFGKACYVELIEILSTLNNQLDKNNDNQYKYILLLKATRDRINIYKNKEEIISKLREINFDENCFEQGTLGWSLCLKEKLQNKKFDIFCKDENELSQLYVKNKDKYEGLFDETKQLLTNLVLETIRRERDANIVLKLLSFDDENRTLQVVGNCYGITRERVRQIFNKSIKILARSFNLNTVQGIINRNKLNIYLLRFLDVPIDCFLVYLKSEKNDYVYNLFVKGLCYNLEVPIDIEHRIDNIIKTHPKCENSAIISLSSRDVMEIIINACEAISAERYFGVTTIAKVLKGANDKKIKTYELNKLNYHGALKFLKEKDIVLFINFLIEKNILNKINYLHPIVKVALNKDFLERDKLDLSVIDEILSTYKVSKKSQEDLKKVVKYKNFNLEVDENGEILTDINLLDCLCDVRRRIASIDKVSFFVVAYNRTLVNLATIKPTSKEEFLAIKGIGEKWFLKYGQEFLQEIKSYLSK